MAKGMQLKRRITKMATQDNFGNEVEYMNWEQFQNFATNAYIWCKGDEIQVRNKDGSVVSTTILTEVEKKN